MAKDEQFLVSEKGDAASESKLLLFSLEEFFPIVEPLIRARSPKTIVEIGVEAGSFCERILRLCSEIGARYVGIDPSLDAVRQEQVRILGGELCLETSLDALRHLPPADIYFVDGDHNYYTVFNELSLILRQADDAGLSPLVFLHDTAWPSGRRDFYYNIDRVPVEFRQPSQFEAAVQPGNPDTCAHGFRVFGTHVSTREGGPRNGVLTAIEDALADHREWKLVDIPAVFGLGILYNPSRLTTELTDRIAEVETGLRYFGPLLARMERNRTQMFDRILQSDALTCAVTHPDAQPSVKVDTPVPWTQLHAGRLHALKFVAKSIAALRPGARKGRLKATELVHALLTGTPTLRLSVPPTKIVCFDMFDTLVRRICHPPETVIRESMDFAWLLMNRNGFKIDRWQVQTARFLAALDLRHKLEGRQLDPECTLREILAATWERLGCPSGLREDLTAAVEEFELEAEIRHIRIMPGALEHLKACKAAGKTTVVASDIYLSAAQLSRILAAVGLLPHIDHVFTSADHRTGKYSGGLFKVIGEALGADFTEMSHIGDNIHSDYFAPKRLRIKSRWYLSPRELMRRDDSRKSGLLTGDPAGITQSDFRILAREFPAENSYEKTLYQLGHTVYGPMFYSFIRHIAEQAVRLRLKDIYFLARDGHGFMQLFEKVWATMSGVSRFPTPRVHYLFISRASSNVILATELGTRGVEIALLKDPWMKIGEFLAFCDLDLPEAEAPESFGLSRDQHLRNMVDTSEFADWISALGANRSLVRKSEGERKKLQDYLFQHDFFSAGAKAIVDIGWNGTIPHFLSQQFGGRSDFPELHVLLFGRCKSMFSSGAHSRYYIHPGFLMDDNGFPFGGKIPLDVPPLIELAASAPHGTTKGYTRDRSDRVQPVFAAAAESEIRGPAAIRHGWVDFVRAIVASDAGNLYLDNDRYKLSAIRLFLSFYRKPAASYVRALSRCIFSMDWKSSEKFDLVGAHHGWRFYLRFLTGGISPALWINGAARRYLVPAVFARLVAAMHRGA